MDANAARDVTGAAAAPPRLEPAPDRIVVREVNWLGDLVISLPALRAIRRAWPRAHLAVLVRQELATFFDGSRDVDEVIGFSNGQGVAGLFDRRRMAAEIRARRFDLAVLFPNSFESALWTALARVPRRAGWSADARGALLTFKAAPTPAALSSHQSHYWLEMVRATLGVEGDAADFAMEAHEPNLERMRAWLGERRRRADSQLVALAPAAAYGPAKEWPAERYSRLIDLLAKHHGAECVLVGAPGERARCEHIAARCSAGAMVAAGETGVGELIALLRLAGGFIGNDSGAMHLAAALGLPAVGIFGSTNPERTGPVGAHARAIWRHLECSPCLARTCRFGHYRCLVEIGADEAADALAEAGGFG